MRNGLLASRGGAVFTECGWGVPGMHSVPGTRDSRGTYVRGSGTGIAGTTGMYPLALLRLVLRR
jgi:hypothetical protein